MEISGKKKRWLLYGAACAVVCVAGGLWLVQIHQGDDALADAGDVAGRAPVAQVDAVHDANAGRPPAVAGRLPRAAGVFSRVPATRAGMPLESDPFGADSVEEQQWLDRNGFPNVEQMHAYAAASDAMLRLAANQGDRLAQVELDSRILMHGDQAEKEEAVAGLLVVAEDGSLYALSLLAAYMAGSRSGNPALGYSLSRIQEFRGDTRVALARDVMFRQPLSPLEKIEAEKNALLMAKEMRLNFRGGEFHDPRPFP